MYRSIKDLPLGSPQQEDYLMLWKNSEQQGQEYKATVSQVLNPAYGRVIATPQGMLAYLDHPYGRYQISGNLSLHPIVTAPDTNPAAVSFYKNTFGCTVGINSNRANYALSYSGQRHTAVNTALTYIAPEYAGLVTLFPYLGASQVPSGVIDTLELFSEDGPSQVPDISGLVIPKTTENVKLGQVRWINGSIMHATSLQTLTMIICPVGNFTLAHNPALTDVELSSCLLHYINIIDCPNISELVLAGNNIADARPILLQVPHNCTIDLTGNPCYPITDPDLLAIAASKNITLI